MEVSARHAIQSSANGLSKPTNRCLAAAGIPIEKESIIPALKAGKLFP